MPTKTIHIRYYAMLREERGQPEETLSTAAATAAELYGALRRQHAFSLDTNSLRVAVNQEYVDWNATLQDRDEVVFVPPVNGG